MAAYTVNWHAALFSYDEQRLKCDVCVGYLVLLQAVCLLSL